jgi:hypothetical protein
MHNRASTYALTFLLIASCAASACDANNVNVTGPTGTSVAVLTVGPTIIAAGTHASTSCRTETPFDAVVTVNVRARRDLFVRNVGFEFIDPANRRVLPIPFPVTSLPLPTTSPIPFPGEATMSSDLVRAGETVTAPFRLQFDCGVPASGTLFVSVDTADAEGGTVVVLRTSAHIGA